MKVLLTAALTASLSLTGVGVAPQTTLPTPAPGTIAVEKSPTAAPASVFHYCLIWWFSNKKMYRKYCL